MAITCSVGDVIVIFPVAFYFSGADPVSISKRLGHAQVSTTQDMYALLIQQADTQSAERIADAIFRSDSVDAGKKNG